MECSTTSCELFNMTKQDFNWSDIIRWLKTQFKVDPTKGIDLKFSEEVVLKLLSILHTINENFLWYNSLEALVQETLTETLKSLRIYVTNEDVARYLISHPEFYIVFGKLMECIFTKKNGQELFTKYMMQLFLNLLSIGDDKQRKETRRIIREQFYHKFRVYFMGTYGYVYEISAVFYNLSIDVDLEDEGIINYILLYHGDPQKTNEYLDFLMERIITSDYIWEIYEDLNIKPHLALLSCLRDVLINSNSDNLLIKVKTLSQPCLEKLTSIFIKSANVIFQVSQPDCVNASQEISYILEILSHASSKERCLQYLQTNKDIFINAGMLLLNVHRLGKMSDNIFTPIQKLTQNENSSIEERNPIFGFKADLVRLIGNMCWKNRKLQDLAREAEVIPVLLDCCNIDEKNPFIIQWVILAIRNICENNRENQDIIAGLTQQGVVDAEILRRCGLTFHTEEDLSVGLIGLNLNK